MFSGFVRFTIFVTTLFVAWLATGRLLAATHPADLQWLGYVQATGVELVLGYCVWLIGRTNEKGIIGLMILFFGLFSIVAQILHAYLYGVRLPNEEQLPEILIWSWRYALPSVPTLAGISIGLLEIAQPGGSGLKVPRIKLPEISHLLEGYQPAAGEVPPVPAVVASNVMPPVLRKNGKNGKNGNGNGNVGADELPFG